MWEGRTKEGQKFRIWSKTQELQATLNPYEGEYEIEFAGDPRERHWDNFIEDVLGKPLSEVLGAKKEEAPLFSDLF